MTFSGDSRGISLTDVLQNIGGNRATGTLQVRGRQGERFMRIEEGGIAGFSMGQGKGLPIVERLCRMGYVDEKAVKRLLAKKKRSRRPVSTLLVEAGLITEEDLCSAVSEQIEECVFELLQFKEAEFTFTEGAPPARVFGVDQRQLKLNLAIGPVLMEGARRNDEWQRISKIVSSERDLFVLLEGWEEFELEPRQAEITAYLDGRTDIGSLMGMVRCSKFDLMKAVSDLCHIGVVRPSTADEIEQAAREAMEGGNGSEAVRLLEQALTIERNNRGLREELAVLLIELGRSKDSSVQFATLGFQSAQEEDYQQALVHYQHAAVLDPEDLPLHEQRLEIVRKVGDRQLIITTVLELTKLYQRMGLADRARELLQTSLAEKSLHAPFELQVNMAQVELCLGHGKESAAIYIQLAEKCLVKDEALGLGYLHSALEGMPDDEALCERIESIESGRAGRLRRRRKRLATLAATAAIFFAVGTAGVMEYVASRHLLSAMESSLLDEQDGSAERALAQLQGISPKLAWTPSGRRAKQVLGRLIDLRLGSLEQLLVQGEYQLASQTLAELRAGLELGDARAACDRLARKLEIEQRAYDVLRRAERYGEKFSEDFDTLAGMSRVTYLDFHIRHFLAITNLQARRAVLSALLEMDNPRSFAVVAKRMIAEADAASLKIERAILAKAEGHRQLGRESIWAPVYAELELAEMQPGTAARAAEILSLLRN